MKTSTGSNARLLFSSEKSYSKYEQRHAPAVAEKKIAIKKQATIQVRGKYRLMLYEQPKQLAFILQDRLLTPIWSYYWLNCHDLKTRKTRLVWSIYFPWDFRKSPE